MHKALFYTVLISLSVVGCTEKNMYTPPEPEPEKPTAPIGSVTLDNYFDYATRKSVKVKVDYSGANCSDVSFKIYAENPFEVVDGQVVLKEGLIAIDGGSTDEDGFYAGTGTIPTGVENVYIYSPDFGAPTLYKASVVGNAIRAQIDFDNAIDLSGLVTDVETKGVATRAKGALTEHILGLWDGKGFPDYLDGQMTIDPVMKKYVKWALPEYGDARQTGLISDDVDITLYEDAANVWISYFGGTTAAQSGFAYYCYRVGDSPAQIKEAARHACLIFPNAHGNALGGYSGVRVKLRYITPEGELQPEGTVFPKDTRIGFALFNDSWKPWGNRKTYYSTKLLNADGRSHTAMFTIKDENDGSVNVISMEDWTDNDYNDVAFVITSDPADAIILPPAPDPGEVTNTLTYQGLLAFEDNWPDGGDYDMNDVVVNYVSNVTYNGHNQVTKIVDRFTLSWTGANYSNGFAYQVPYDLAKATVQFLNDNGSKVSGNVITLTNDVKGTLGVPGVPAGQMPESVVGASYTAVITFDEPSINKDEIVPPYNPYIKVGGSNQEVHLINHPTTAEATNVFDQSSMDISDGKTTFFVSKEGYPFSIHLDARIYPDILELDLRHEGQHIDEIYPKFADWATTKDPTIKWWIK